MRHVVVAKIFFSMPLCRTPWIIEAWLSWSERIRQSGISRPMVEIAASFETNPEVNTSAASLRCKSASERSSSTSGPVGAGNVARAAGADAELFGRLLHRRDHLGMLAHAEIVVGAPDGDLAGIVGLVAIHRRRKPAGDPLDVGEDAIALLLPQRIDCVFEDAPIIHARLICPVTGRGDPMAWPRALTLVNSPRVAAR